MSRPRWVPDECDLCGATPVMAVWYVRRRAEFVGVCTDHNPVSRSNPRGGSSPDLFPRYKKRPPGGWDRASGAGGERPAED